MNASFYMNFEPDMPSLNGRIYSKECCDKMMEDIKNKVNLIYMGDPCNIESGKLEPLSYSTVAAKVEDVKYDGGRILVESIILDILAVIKHIHPNSCTNYVLIGYLALTLLIMFPSLKWIDL